MSIEPTEGSREYHTNNPFTTLADPPMQPHNAADTPQWNEYQKAGMNELPTIPGTAGKQITWKHLHDFITVTNNTHTTPHPALMDSWIMQLNEHQPFLHFLPLNTFANLQEGHTQTVTKLNRQHTQTRIETTSKRTTTHTSSSSYQRWEHNTPLRQSTKPRTRQTK
jgi:hypothetical protein